MGRRKKAAKKVVKKKRPIVSKVFKCLFCNQDKSVGCTLDTKSMTGQLTCNVCDAKYQTRIHALTEPIDVFTEWLDETADAQNKVAKKLIMNTQPRVAKHADEDDYVTSGYKDSHEADEFDE